MNRSASSNIDDSGRISSYNNRDIDKSTNSIASIGQGDAAHEVFPHIPTTPSISSISSSSSSSSAASSCNSVLLTQPVSIPVTTVAERGHALHDPCIDEMENCSLQENERCNCVWQLMRSVHAIFHWLNRISCVRHGKCQSHGDEQDEADLQKKNKRDSNELTIYDASSVASLKDETSNKLDRQTVQQPKPQQQQQQSSPQHKSKQLQIDYPAVLYESLSRQNHDDITGVERFHKATFEEKLA